MPKGKETYVQGSMFEDDYLIRTLGPLAHSAEIALTEIVANAWDASSTTVDILIPEKNQASGYLDEITTNRGLLGNPYRYAFVVGDTFSGKMNPVSIIQNANNVEVG